MDPRAPFWTRIALAGLGLAAAAWAQAQSSCSSDGQRPPTGLTERFLSAQCPDCWQARGTPPPPHSLALDWIVPSREQGEEAALSAAATRDSLERLPELGLTEEQVRLSTAAPLQRQSWAGAPRGRLRVGHGLPVNDYIGTSIEWHPRDGAHLPPLSAWLLLVEDLPAGAEGSPVERQIVRNSLYLDLPPHPGRAWRELRPMRIPEGSRVERLRVLGWVEDGFGHMVAISESICKTSPTAQGSR
ncbi:MAG: hypothetical protein JOY84_18755 [Curvibacter sp.]|nr:hypothetical protein [Curvibacter sp.]